MLKQLTAKAQPTAQPKLAVLPASWEKRFMPREYDHSRYRLTLPFPATMVA
ncbi:MAG: hypothetical protein ACK4QL_02165 [Pseudanabaenaceae cyanobacterium]